MAREAESNGAGVVHGEELRPRARGHAERGLYRAVGVPAADSSGTAGTLTNTYRVGGYECSCCQLVREERRDDFACWLPGCPGLMFPRECGLDTIPIPKLCPHGAARDGSRIFSRDCPQCALYLQTRAQMWAALALNLITCALVVLLIAKVSP